MPLYQNSVLKKYLKQQDKDAVAKAFKKFTKYFHDTKIQENIRSSKEEEYQGIFLTELFSKILGYTMKPNANFDLVAEFKNEKNSKKADGAILKDNQALGVIELKGTNTKDLEKVRQQAFDYKANQTGCVYVITSNFEKIRFYINNAVDFEEFDLFTLNQVGFELLYLCLAKDNLLNNVPLKIKEASVQEEEAITKKFYKDYSTFKRELFRDLVKLNMKNEVFRAELNSADADRGTKNIKQALFKKSQKLIDRFLFIFFAEDRGLLPPNSTVKILEQWNKLKELDEHVPLYSRYKKYFNYLDTGRKGTDKTAEIFAYNGGLFKPDSILDSLLISDDLLYKHTKDLQAHDFESQVDVNILGHIFENSLNEIESVNAEIEGAEFDKQKTKRKKDGVFYTPKYITKYIVDNTVGKLCNEKKDALGILKEDFSPNRQTATKKKLLASIETYREWLLQLTICDPACGSGAFLNQALDFLIKEHEYIDELQAKLLGGGLVFPNIETTVLENNIYGVDLNEESVEIAKLSLWLRTAQPRRKLNDLSSNIKCGNSLIDSKTVAGDKAFKWEEEYPHVFEKGGFDVVIGNPPYVNVENVDEKSKRFLYDNYVSVKGRTDLYIAFTELIFNIINEKALTGIIIPFSITNQNYAEVLRDKIINKHGLLQIVDTTDYFVFEDAVVKTVVLIMSKVYNKGFTEVFKSYKPFSLTDSKHILPQEKFKLLNKTIFETKPIHNFLDLKTKIEKQSIPLERICLVAYGVRVNNKNDKTKPKSYYVTNEKNSGYKKFVEGKDIQRYTYSQTGFLNYQPTEHYNSMFPELFENEKLMFINVVSDKVRFAYDDKGFYNSHTVINCVRIDKLINADHSSAKKIMNTTDLSLVKKYNTKFLLGIVNSKLLNWYFFNFQSEGLHFYPDDAKRFPIVKINSEHNQSSFISLTNLMIKETESLQKIIYNYNKYLQSQFSIEKLSKKLQNWHDLNFGDFLKELNKAIKKAGGEKLTKMDEMEWMDVFETKKAEAQTLKAEIDKTDKEIDQMVYELYGLTEEEIQIVENS